MNLQQPKFMNYIVVNNNGIINKKKKRQASTKNAYDVAKLVFEIGLTDATN